MRSFKILFSVTQGVGTMLCILVLVWIFKFRDGFGWGVDYKSQFNWHPFLTTLGMGYLYANSILIFRSLKKMRKQQLKYLHTGLNGIILVLIIISLYAVISARIIGNRPNFFTLHSWFGIVTVVIFFVQWIIGFVAFLYPGLSPAIRSAILPLHVYFGLAGFVLAITSCITGFVENAIAHLGKTYSSFPGEGVLMNIIGLLFGIFGLLVVYIATKNNYKLEKNASRNGVE